MADVLEEECFADDDFITDELALVSLFEADDCIDEEPGLFEHFAEDDIMADELEFAVLFEEEEGFVEEPKLVFLFLRMSLLPMNLSLLAYLTKMNA